MISTVFSFAKDQLRRLFCVSGFYIMKIKPTEDEVLRSFFELLRNNSASVPLIRVGSVGDGGYLMPKCVAEMDLCLSPGVADWSDFEYDLAENYGIQCCLADYGVNAPALDHDLFHFTKKYLGIWNDEGNIRLSEWMQQCVTAFGDGEMILQMDIEGAEYSVLLDLEKDALAKFSIVVIEFHYLERLFDRNEFNIIFNVFNRLFNDFSIVHIHPNNACPMFKREGFEVPSVVEITFLKKNKIPVGAGTNNFGMHPLDKPNSTKRNDFEMPQCWRQ